MIPRLWLKAKRNWRASWWMWKLALNSTFKKLRSWHPVPSLHVKYMGKQWKQWLYFWGLQSHCTWWLQPLVIKRRLLLGRKAMTNLDTILKNRDITSQSYGFASSHVCMWELNYKERWAPENWHLSTLMLEKILESPLDCKEIHPVNPKGNQSWIFIGRTDAEAETPILWPPDVRNWLIGQDPDAGKYWRWEEKGMTEDEIVGWHHQLNGHEFEQAPGVGVGQGCLAWSSPWGHKEWDTAVRLE